ncbi:hypothetical protein J6836_07540 [Providencia sp. R33]|uniref:phage tail fiber protein n=1 Tax=Providencia sp. R33 TaxID=2828763 RepID=UPI001C5B3D47|nr:hypothetical protein [Providencia sp. R33]QXX84216.1 hypothetical protein J6836_07540 [Providencia sp. R33]
MYNIGTVTITANSNKLVGTGTKWKENINGIQPQQVIQIVVGGIVYNSSIQSIESDTALTLNFPFHAAVKDAKYVILTTMVNSVSSATNYMVALNTSNMQARDVANAFMTLEGTVSMTAPDGTKVNLRTAKEMDKQLDGKFDKAGGDVNGAIKATGAIQTNQGEITAYKDGGSGVQISGSGNEAVIKSRNMGGAWQTHIIPNSAGTLMQVGDFGLGSIAVQITQGADLQEFFKTVSTGFYRGGASEINKPAGVSYADYVYIKHGAQGKLICYGNTNITYEKYFDGTSWSNWATSYSTANTTKDANGNLKAASPIVKLFADDIELNDESEGVEMEHLGVGHYLIKGVVGFNADGAWGINNGFVIPQDHNGKNMVLIDYEVRPDGDIEVFVFHQQNADMPERFQNKRIKHFDEEGVPVYFENYEACDVPESRWIDMRVEMPPNSLYNQKQAEAERLAKIEAERLAQEEVKRIAEEAERADQKVE